MSKVFDPVRDGSKLVTAIQADGLLIDTYDKNAGKSVLDYLSIKDIGSVVRSLHRHGAEAWLAGSLTAEQMPSLWEAGIDVICIRQAACESSETSARFGRVRAKLVRQLVATIPSQSTRAR